MGTIKYIAFCEDPVVFLNNRAIDERESRKYPGLSMIPILAKKLKSIKIIMETADISMRKIIEGRYKPEEVGLISAGGSKLGEYLVKLGAVPIIISAGESPLWMPDLYINLEKYINDYKYKIFFTGAFSRGRRMLGQNLNHFYFPSWDGAIPVGNCVINSGKTLTAVIGNKYIISRTGIKSRIKRMVKLLIPGIFREKEMIRKMIFDNELQTKRLELISFFAENLEIDLFGPGWDDISNLPLNWQSRMIPFIKSIYKGVAKNKIKTISNYKFTLCLENVRFPGYITEKIIDCFVAGTVPLYLGAPNVGEYIPRDAFIDISKFRSNQDLLDYLLHLGDGEYLKILEHGREFLLSDEGMKYSHEAVADFYFSLISREFQ